MHTHPTHKRMFKYDTHAHIYVHTHTQTHTHAHLRPHTGTHIDSPGHFVWEAYASGKGMESLDLQVMNGM